MLSSHEHHQQHLEAVSELLGHQLVQVVGVATEAAKDRVARARLPMISGLATLGRGMSTAAVAIGLSSGHSSNAEGKGKNDLKT